MKTRLCPGALWWTICKWVRRASGRIGTRQRGIGVGGLWRWRRQQKSFCPQRCRTFCSLLKAKNRNLTYFRSFFANGIDILRKRDAAINYYDEILKLSIHRKVGLHLMFVRSWRYEYRFVLLQTFNPYLLCLIAMCQVKQQQTYFHGARVCVGENKFK